MTGCELNQYILHYLQEDKTKSAIMLTGEWGSGKSYYVQNELIPFLRDDHNFECVVTSLYGVESIDQINKNIYVELRLRWPVNAVKRFTSRFPIFAKIQKLFAESFFFTFLYNFFHHNIKEVTTTGINVANTIVKSVIVNFGIDFDHLQPEKIYSSIDLSKKLLIFEDMERSGIDVLKFLGYVNNLVEQDGVKVLIVANESKFLQYDKVETKKDATNSQTSFSNAQETQIIEKPTDETLKYLEIKEKTISDTLIFQNDLDRAIREIIASFSDDILNCFTDDDLIKDISNIMSSNASHNLRSLIFACQKTVDIYRAISVSNTEFSEDFLKTILYGVISFSLKLKNGNEGKNVYWKNSGVISFEYGYDKFPLFRFCFDYITTHKMDIKDVSLSVDVLNDLRLYDHDKSQNDPELIPIFEFWCYSEDEVKQSVDILRKRLIRSVNSQGISFYDYSRLARNLIQLSHYLEIDVSDIKTLLIDVFVNMKVQRLTIKNTESGHEKCRD